MSAAPHAEPPPVEGARDLRALFDPRSVAVLGGSDNPAKWGHSVARSLLAAQHRRPVYLVSRTKREILGRPTHPSLADLPEAPELVVLVVPAAVFEESVDAALAAGARALVAITAGLGERGTAGRAVERAVAERVRAAGALLLGPNCMGLVDTETELAAAPWIDLPGGDIALVSQSGNLSFDLASRARAAGLGFSRFVSLGNQADVEAAEVVASCVGHAATRLVAAYCEDFRDGRAFARAALAAHGAGKPVVLLAPGRTEAGVRAARSHTGALATRSAVVDAVCHAAGILRVHTPRELMDLALALRSGRRPRGRRVAVLTTGGGNGVIAADALAATGLVVPPLSDALARTVEALVPELGSAANPVDLIGATLDDARLVARVAEILLRSEEVDAVVMTGSPLAMWHGFDEEQAALEEASVPLLREAAEGAGKPLLLNPDRLETPAVRAGLEAGLPIYRDVESAAAALARLAEAWEHPPEGVPRLPEPSPRRLGAGGRLAGSSPRPAPRAAAAGPVPEGPPSSSAGPGAGGYLEARQLLQDAGVPFVEARLVSDLEEASAAATELGFPVVLKALGFLHKSDVGAVALALEDEGALAAALARMATSLSPEAYSVERMAPVGEGVELIAGCRLDPRFGPVALAGAGGLYAELLDDVRLALAPLDEGAAERLLRKLRVAPLLLGHRGRPPVDLAAAARAVAAVSQVGAAYPDLAEIEVNPLLVTPAGAVALDARLLLRDDDARR